MLGFRTKVIITCYYFLEFVTEVIVYWWIDIPFISASMGQAWLLGTASQVRSAPRAYLCCLIRTALVSSGLSWSLSVCTVAWRTTWPTLTPRTWSGLRPCCATCSPGHPDAPRFKPSSPAPQSIITSFTKFTSVLQRRHHCPCSSLSSLSRFCLCLCHSCIGFYCLNKLVISPRALWKVPHTWLFITSP